MISRATGLALNTVARGRNELRAGAKGRRPCERPDAKARAVGISVEVHPELLPALKRLVDPATRGDRSGVRFAMEREERCRFVARAVRRARHPSERQDHWQTAPSTRLQPSGCRRRPSRAGSTRIATRAVRAHRCGGEALRRARRAVHLRRHEEEEGVGRQLQERGRRVAAEADAPELRRRARFSRRRARQGDPVRRPPTSRTTAASSMSAPTMTHRSSRSFRSQKRGGSGWAC